MWATGTYKTYGREWHSHSEEPIREIASADVRTEAEMQRVAALVVTVGLLLSGSASAQDAAITGVVTDASGAVLPGVTVETTSAALTEKVRSVVTDGTGQYRIIALPPGS